MTELIITSSVLILVVILLRHFLKGKISLRLQYALWALVLLRLLVPVTLFESPISVMHAVQAAKTAREASVASAPAQTLSSAYGDMGAKNAAVQSGTEQSVTDSITNATHHVFRWGLWARWVWYIGIGIVGLTLLLSNLSFGRKLRKTRIRYQKDNCKLPVYTVDTLPSPCLFGFFRPSIYITSEVAGDETKLGHVMAHELTHYRQGDHIWAALRGLSLAVHWYHPLVWLAAALSRRDSELACDEGTIKRIGEEGRMEYGRTLIGLTCEKRRAMDLLCCATTMTDGKNGIKERVTLIAKKPKMATYTLVAIAVIAAVAVGCTFTGARNENAKSIPLTVEEVERYNKTFEQILFDDRGNPFLNPLSHFLTSCYHLPEDLNLTEFMRYFSSEDVTDEAEFAALKAEENWPHGDVTLDRMPVPIHKIKADDVNKALQEHMGITLKDLSGVGTMGLIYLKEYDAYYNFTSDAGAGYFVCASGEKQGDIVRLFGENTTLTLKLQGDGFLIVSHQHIGNAADQSAGEVSTLSVKVEAGGSIPQAVIDYAVEYVSQQANNFNELGQAASGAGGYAITDAKITGLTQINTGTAGRTSGVNLYLLEYRLRPDHLENVVLAGGMQMEEIAGEDWITEWGSTGQPYLLLAWDDGGTETSWQRVCVTNTDRITVDYGTPEMLERYGDAFTAAAMELYREKLIHTIGQVPDVYTREGELGHTAVKKVAELLMTELLDDLEMQQNGRTFTITDWKNLSVSADRMYDAWLVTGEVEVRYAGILSPIGDSDIVPEGEYVSVSLGERYLRNDDGVYTLSLSAGEQQAILEKPILTSDMSIGIGVIPDYIGDDILIFHGYFGLFVYDLKAEKITFAVDLEKAVGTTIIQGSEGVAVRVSADGNTIQLYFYPEQGEPLMAYTIDSHIGNYDYGYYAPLDAYDTSAADLYDTLSHGTLGELTYTDGKNSWLLFSGWDWAN